jgi:hypothetical protein
MKSMNYNLWALYQASSFPCEAYVLIAYSESKGEVAEEIIEKMFGREYIDFLDRVVKER